MKAIITGLALLTAVVFTACSKTPDLNKLSSDFAVMTKYDTAAKFTSYFTFSIRDTIALATDNPKDSLWYDANSKSIIESVRSHLKLAGYTEIHPSAATDLGVQVSAVRNVTRFNVTPGYWWGYNGYTSPCYWGHCDDYPYYYPYWYSYSVKTGTLIIEIVDLKNASAKKKLNVIWTGIGSGQIGNSQSFIVEECLKTVDQSFKQSPYIKGY